MFMAKFASSILASSSVFQGYLPDLIEANILSCVTEPVLEEKLILQLNPRVSLEGPAAEAVTPPTVSKDCSLAL